MQLVDELSMIYTTCLMCYASFHTRDHHQSKCSLPLHSQDSRFLSHYTTTTCKTPSSTRMPTHFSPPSSCSVACTLWKSPCARNGANPAKKIASLGRGQGLPVLSKERQEYENVRDLKTLKTMWFMVVYGLSMFLGGFAIWNLDNFFCGTLRTWRQQIGLPWVFSPLRVMVGGEFRSLLLIEVLRIG